MTTANSQAFATNSNRSDLFSLPTGLRPELAAFFARSSDAPADDRMPEERGVLAELRTRDGFDC
jgi:hypothetical protein